jgi:hypothetical protein
MTQASYFLRSVSPNAVAPADPILLPINTRPQVMSFHERAAIATATSDKVATQT